MRRRLSAMSTPANGRRPGSTSARWTRSRTPWRPAPGCPRWSAPRPARSTRASSLTDRSGTVLAVAARSPADERAVLADGDGVEVLELRVADEPVGRAARARARRRPARPGAGAARHDADRLRGRARPGARARLREAAASASSRELLGRELADARPSSRAPAELGVDLEAGRHACWSSAPIAHGPPTTAGARACWRVAERGARAAVAGALAARARERHDVPGAEVVVLLPGDDEAPARARGRVACCASCRPRCPATASRWAAAASPPTRPSCTARGQRGAAGRQRRRGRPRAPACSRSTRPAPTGCCCRR